ncbi:MAG: LLM class flavin-dependent oxidoreductase [Gammaproteobacteria bacterium]|nr:LLM class flavin-dependent oxidoreductase [Gammaproteobacteria bacterium]
MARQVNFGLWYDMRNPARWRVPFEQLYSQTLDQIVWAESIGFDSVWLTEHHFCDDGYTPSPLVIAAAIGARTKRMRIATNLLQIPLHDPIRLAEDAATVSLLTGGRFDLGVALGYREHEFAAFNRKLTQRPSLLEESVEILRRAWRGEAINFQGRRFAVGDLRITPQPEHPPRILIGGMVQPAIERAARLGDGFLSTGGIGHDIYAAATQSGKAGMICAGDWAIVSPDPEREAAAVGEHVLYQINEYVGWGAFGPPESVPKFPDAAAALRDGLYELSTPQATVPRLTKMLKAYPQIVDVHFWAQFPGERVAAGSRRIECLAREVLPKVRAALS